MQEHRTCKSSFDQSCGLFLALLSTVMLCPFRPHSMIYAYDRCMEVAIAACATPVVGLIAENLYGYEGPVARRQVPLSSLPSYATWPALSSPIIGWFEPAFDFSENPGMGPSCWHGLPSPSNICLRMPDSSIWQS